MNISYMDEYITCSEVIEKLLSKDNKVVNLIVLSVDNNKPRKIVDDLFKIR